MISNMFRALVVLNLTYCGFAIYTCLPYDAYGLSLGSVPSGFHAPAGALDFLRAIWDRFQDTMLLEEFGLISILLSLALTPAGVALRRRPVWILLALAPALLTATLYVTLIVWYA